MILNYDFSNYRSFKGKAEFSMIATASQAKSDNIFMCTHKVGEERLLKSAVIYGANASGKTSIISQLYYLREAIRSASPIFGGENVGRVYTPFQLDKDSAQAPSTIDIEFVVNGIKYLYHVKFTTNIVLEETLSYYPNSASKADLFSRNIFGEKHTPKYPTTPSAQKPDFEVFKNKLIISKFLFDTPHEFITPAAKYLASINIAHGYNKIMKDQLWEENKDWLSIPKNKTTLSKLLKVADLGVNSIITKEDLKYEDIRLVHATKDYTDGLNPEISIHYESLGTTQLLIMGISILRSLETGTPLFVDEIDSGFHTYLSDFILQLFTNPRINKKNAQLIFTTHDINLLNEDKIRRDQVWFTSKNKFGESELYSLSDFNGVREDTPFAKWYLANKFGAVPEISTLEDIFNE